MVQLKNAKLFKQASFINGKWVQANSKKTIPVYNPYDGKVLGKVPYCGKKETVAAIEAAARAQIKWRELSAKARSDLMWAWAEAIDANKEDLARLMTLEQGKPISESRGEIDYANGFVKWYAEEARRVYGDIIPANKAEQRLLVIKQPIGVVAAITPWNFPAAMITRKIAPALAVGCTVVLKPAEETPYSAYALAYLAESVGFPKGVINFLTGDAVAIGAEMTANPLVRKLSFTGSTQVGRLLMAQSAPTIKKLSLELGGNAPFIVFEDADLDAAVEGCMISKFRNTGQTCVCANRIFVQDKVYEAFLKKLIPAVKKLKVGNGLKEDTTQGPLINEKALTKVETHIKDAVRKGAKVMTGGEVIEDLCFQPTILSNVKSNMILAKEETFGPVAPLFRFKTDQEVIDQANNTEFGLASYFYSKDMSRIWRVAEALEYGMVGINTGLVSTEVAPFGGIKQSGLGREGSKYGVDDYLEMKYLCLQLSP